jgi:hypothetical protein
MMLPPNWGFTPSPLSGEGWGGVRVYASPQTARSNAKIELVFLPSFTQDSDTQVSPL